MFEDNFIDIYLTDAEIYYLAEEMKLEKLIGVGIDFELLSKEEKIAIKQDSYDLLEKQIALQMNFSGETTVDEKYANIVKRFENPDYCAILQEWKADDDTSSQRKIYKNGDLWTGLDYFNVAASFVLEFDNEDDVNKFFFNGETFSGDNDAEEIEFETIDKGLEAISEFKIIYEFIKTEETYEFVQVAYAKYEDAWYIVQSEEESERITLMPVVNIVTLS